MNGAPGTGPLHGLDGGALRRQRLAGRAGAAISRLGLRERADAGWLALGLGAFLLLGLAVLLVVGLAERLGAFRPALLAPVADARRLDNLRRGPDAPPLVAAVHHDARDALAVLRADGTLHLLDRASSLWHEERPLAEAGLPPGALGTRPLLRAGCGDLDRAAGPCADPAPLWLVGGPETLLRRDQGLLGRSWHTVIGPGSFRDATGRPLGEDDLTAAAASAEGRWTAHGSAEGRVALFDETRRRWLPAEGPIVDALAGTRVEEIVWSGDAFWVGSARGLWRLPPPAEGETAPGEAVAGVGGTILDLAEQPGRGLLVLEQRPCPTGEPAGCLRLVRLDRAGAIARTLLDETEVIPSLTGQGLIHATVQAGRLIVAGSAGVLAYDPEARRWERVLAAPVRAVAPAAEDGLWVAADGASRTEGGRYGTVRQVRGGALLETPLWDALDAVPEELIDVGGQLVARDAAGGLQILTWDEQAEAGRARRLSDPQPTGFDPAIVRRVVSGHDRVALIASNGILAFDATTRATRFAPRASLTGTNAPWMFGDDVPLFLTARELVGVARFTPTGSGTAVLARVSVETAGFGSGVPQSSSLTGMLTNGRNQPDGARVAAAAASGDRFLVVTESGAIWDATDAATFRVREGQQARPKPQPWQAVSAAPINGSAWIAAEEAWLRHAPEQRAWLVLPRGADEPRATSIAALSLDRAVAALADGRAVEVGATRAGWPVLGGGLPGIPGAALEDALLIGGTALPEDPVRPLEGWFAWLGLGTPGALPPLVGPLEELMLDALTAPETRLVLAGGGRAVWYDFSQRRFVGEMPLPPGPARLVGWHGSEALALGGTTLVHGARTVARGVVEAGLASDLDRVWYSQGPPGRLALTGADLERVSPSLCLFHRPSSGARQLYDAAIAEDGLILVATDAGLRAYDERWRRWWRIDWQGHAGDPPRAIARDPNGRFWLDVGGGSPHQSELVAPELRDPCADEPLQMVGLSAGTSPVALDAPEVLAVAEAARWGWTTGPAGVTVTPASGQGSGVPSGGVPSGGGFADAAGDGTVAFIDDHVTGFAVGRVEGAAPPMLTVSSRAGVELRPLDVAGRGLTVAARVAPSPLGAAAALAADRITRAIGAANGASRQALALDGWGAVAPVDPGGTLLVDDPMLRILRTPSGLETWLRVTATGLMADARWERFIAEAGDLPFDRVHAVAVVPVSTATGSNALLAVATDAGVQVLPFGHPGLPADRLLRPVWAPLIAPPGPLSPIDAVGRPIGAVDAELVAATADGRCVALTIGRPRPTGRQPVEPCAADAARRPLLTVADPLWTWARQPDGRVTGGFGLTPAEAAAAPEASAVFSRPGPEGPRLAAAYPQDVTSAALRCGPIALEVLDERIAAVHAVRAQTSAAALPQPAPGVTVAGPNLAGWSAFGLPRLTHDFGVGGGPVEALCLPVHPHAPDEPAWNALFASRAGLWQVSGHDPLAPDAPLRLVPVPPDSRTAERARDRLTGTLGIDQPHLRARLLGRSARVEARTGDGAWTVVPWERGRLTLDSAVRLFPPAAGGPAQPMMLTDFGLTPLPGDDPRAPEVGPAPPPAQIALAGGLAGGTDEPCPVTEARLEDGVLAWRCARSARRVLAAEVGRLLLEGGGRVRPRLLEEDPFVRQQVIAPTQAHDWSAQLIDSGARRDRTLELAWRGIPLRLVGGRFDIDTLRAVASVDGGRIDVVSAAAGWTRHPADSLALDRLERPEAAEGGVDPAAVRSVHVGRDADRPVLCLDLPGGARARLLEDRAEVTTAACAEHLGATPLWRLTRDARGRIQQEAADRQSGVQLRRLVDGRFADTVLRGLPLPAPGRGGGAEHLLPTAAGVLALDGQGRSIGLWPPPPGIDLGPEGPPALLLPDQGGRALIAGGGIIRPVDPASGIGAGTLDLAPLLPPGALPVALARAGAGSLGVEAISADGRLIRHHLRAEEGGGWRATPALPLWLGDRGFFLRNRAAWGDPDPLLEVAATAEGATLSAAGGTALVPAPGLDHLPPLAAGEGVYLFGPDDVRRLDLAGAAALLHGR